jgi:hypothetical protein
LKAWVEIIERDEAKKRADLLEIMALANVSGVSKKANKSIEDAVKKLRENL